MSSTEQMIKVTVPDQQTASVPAPGYKSTEFLSAVTVVAGMVFNAVPEKFAPLAAAVVSVYMACRTLLKVLHVLGYAKQVPDLPDVPKSLPTDEKVSS